MKQFTEIDCWIISLFSYYITLTLKFGHLRKVYLPACICLYDRKAVNPSDELGENELRALAAREPVLCRGNRACLVDHHQGYQSIYNM